MITRIVFVVFCTLGVIVSLDSARCGSGELLPGALGFLFIIYYIIDTMHESMLPIMKIRKLDLRKQYEMFHSDWSTP